MPGFNNVVQSLFQIDVRKKKKILVSFSGWKTWIDRSSVLEYRHSCYTDIIIIIKGFNIILLFYICQQIP